ncbi:HIT-like domain-containing protein [Tricharina praecox]|uniref:HIT-like domain-containing protein n=1 Tax=Tricharina praecox TaxID=43433 RepID=UPI00221E8B1D|nr:HIT-like domain-containing protein [Tricharina praecox]KAI5846021.1 HIT-like domain-containing protein [Tricharina praecox]
MPKSTPSSLSSRTAASTNKNAFSVLMSSRPTSTTPTSSTAPRPARTTFADALLPYITTPSSFPPSVVLHHSTDFVWIRDKYAKSFIHTLLLPRDPARNTQHPLELLSRDVEFLEKVRVEAAKLRGVVARELERRFGGNGKQGGRNWVDEVLVGVHAHPSLRHLHVHVLSRDLSGEALRKASHYNSFTTGFFVRLEEFPLSGEELEKRGGGWRKEELRCWRCGRGFGRSFVKLKAHLGVEFEAWKAAPMEEGEEEGEGEEGEEDGREGGAGEVGETG